MSIGKKMSLVETIKRQHFPVSSEEHDKPVVLTCCIFDDVFTICEEIPEKEHVYHRESSIKDFKNVVEALATDHFEAGRNVVLNFQSTRTAITQKGSATQYEIPDFIKEQVIANIADVIDMLITE